MTEEFSLKEGPARYQLDEVLTNEDTYRGYFDQRWKNSIIIGFNMYGDRYEDQEEHGRPHLCPKFDIENMRKIVNSAEIPGLTTEEYPSADAEAGFLMKVEWNEYPGHEEFAYDLEEIVETIHAVDEYLQGVEEEGNRIANELSRGL